MKNFSHKFAAIYALATIMLGCTQLNATLIRLENNVMAPEISDGRLNPDDLEDAIMPQDNQSDDTKKSTQGNPQKNKGRGHRRKHKGKTSKPIVKNQLVGDKGSASCSAKQKSPALYLNTPTMEPLNAKKHPNTATPLDESSTNWNAAEQKVRDLVHKICAAKGTTNTYEVLTTTLFNAKQYPDTAKLLDENGKLDPEATIDETVWNMIINNTI